ncbi:MAG: cytochrome P450 [Solirubrobacterales bacterium]|nr:cytochrome P450 [Solirubrobacterales bacterium]
MPFTKTPSLIARLQGELPSSGQLPATIQTAGCRWFAFRYFEEAHRRFGDRFTVYPIYMPPLVFLSDPEDIRAVLTADPAVLHPGAGSKILTPLIGKRSFMLLEEEEHRTSRRAITPAFHQRVIREHAAMLQEMVAREVAAWPLDTALALHPRLRSLTLRVILKTIFGEQAQTLDELHAELMSMLTITTSFLLQEPNLRYLPGWRPTWRTFIQRRTQADMLIYGLMSWRRAERGCEQTGLLDMLLDGEQADGAPMTDREIRDNLMSMILAGHETTTGELAWAFQLLAHHQPVQDKLLEEIDAGTDEEYLTATVNETMRRRPVFLFVIPREVIAPVEIGGRTYRPPVHLAGCTYLMHHNPELYPRPYEFRPERFIDETQQPRTWLPWGGGRKHCLGRHFALLEVKTILREVLATRRVLAASAQVEAPRWRSAILVPGKGGRVVLRRRR